MLSPEEIPETLRETLACVVRGDMNHEIAEARGYSHSAILRHVTALLVVYEARNRAHLAALAVARGDAQP